LVCEKDEDFGVRGREHQTGLQGGFGFGGHIIASKDMTGFLGKRYGLVGKLYKIPANTYDPLQVVVCKRVSGLRSETLEDQREIVASRSAR